MGEHESSPPSFLPLFFNPRGNHPPFSTVTQRFLLLWRREEEETGNRFLGCRKQGRETVQVNYARKERGGREKMAPLKLGGGKLEDTVLWPFLRTFFWTRIQCTGGIFVLSFSLRESLSPSIPWGIEDGRDFFLPWWQRRKWKQGCHNANYFAKYFFQMLFWSTYVFL